MDCCLIVFQPYRPLVQYCQDLGVEDSVLPTAWRIVSDSLRTDVSLLFPPYLISLSCLHMACVILNKDCRSWFSELHVDMDKIQEISKYLLNLYDLWKSFDEKKEMSGVLAKMPKPKQQPTHPQMQQNNWWDIYYPVNACFAVKNDQVRLPNEVVMIRHFQENKFIPDKTIWYL